MYTCAHSFKDSHMYTYNVCLNGHKFCKGMNTFLNLCIRFEWILHTNQYFNFILLNKSSNEAKIMLYFKASLSHNIILIRISSCSLAKSCKFRVSECYNMIVKHYCCHLYCPCVECQRGGGGILSAQKWVVVFSKLSWKSEKR